MASKTVPEELVELLVCPITCQQLKDPVLAPDGHTYERVAIEEWLEHSGTSPFTREPMSVADLKTNEKAVEMLQQLARSHQQVIVRSSTSAHSSASNLDSSALSSSQLNTITIRETASLRTIRPEAFTALDELSDLITGVTDSFQSPQVVVLGTESHGKSTILERLAGLPIFPRDKTLCTRVPVRVRFRRGPTQCIRMWEQGVEQATGRPQGDPKELLQEASYVAGTRVLERVRKTMAEIMRQLNKKRGQSGVSLKHEIVVHLQGPTYPDIDLVDLPGLVEMAHDGEDPKMPEKTRDLSGRYLDEHGNHSMFIVALHCMTDMHNSAAVRLLKEKNVLDKTLGVLTKCDLFRQEEDDSDDEEDSGDHTMSAIGKGLTQLLSPRTNRNFVNTGYGWMLLSSKNLPKYDKPASDNDWSTSPNQLLSGLSKCQTKETAFFKQHGVAVEKDAGITALCQRVTTSFGRYIHEKWVPLAISHVRNASSQLIPAIEVLGIPFVKQGDTVSDEMMDEALNQHVVTEEALSAELRERLIAVLQDQQGGLFSSATAWMSQLLQPLRKALRELRDVRQSVWRDGASESDDMLRMNPAFFDAVAQATNAMQSAAQTARDVLSQSGLVEGASEHPIAAAMRNLLVSDETPFKLKRFHWAIDAIISRISRLLGEWSQTCAIAVGAIADVACGRDIFKADSSLTEAASAGVVRRVKSSVQQDVATTIDLSKTLATVCQESLWERARDVGGLVQQCEAELKGRSSNIGDGSDWIRDESACQRLRLTDQKDVLIAAEGRLIALVPEDVDVEAAVRHARANQLREDPTAAEDFEKMLESTDLDGHIKSKIRSVFYRTSDVLDFKKKAIRNAGATVLGKALEMNDNLQILRLQRTDIHAPGAEALATALKSNTHLKELHLSSNALGDRGAVALGKALEINTSLQTLGVQNNGIGDKGAAALAKALETNTSLQMLFISGNLLSDKVAERLLKVAHSDGRLTVEL